MQGLKEIKQRIKGVTNIKQITKAMEMVAVNRVRKAEVRMSSARPYAENICKLLKRVSSGIEGKSIFFEKKESVKKIKILLISSDKGLCGAYNANIIQKSVKFIRDQTGKEVSFYLLGKKAASFFKSRDYIVDKINPLIVEKLVFKDINNIAEELVAEYEDGKFDELYIMFTKFVNLSKNISSVMKLLPVNSDVSESESKSTDYIFEPSCDAILERLIPKYVVSQILSTILESLTSESAARMVAMKGASENAEEIIGDLKRVYNKARQEAITNELLEIISGAEALRK